ncbi:MAG TPA: beta-1,6-N-acetylglucosaminyltransferase [Hyphomicrobiales bacterium]|nr:beta-1,6-N-acetylglucosaminyltransferase [Hyphomicrobiales bacterium]
MARRLPLPAALRYRGRVRIAFILLAHEAAGRVLRLARLLLAADPDCAVVIHYDLHSPKAEFARLEAAAADEPRLRLVRDRVACGWGQFGLVDGPVRAMRLIREQGIACDREMLLSGSCLPVRPLAQLRRFLAERPEAEFIQCRDESWILGGLRRDRWLYHHVWNEQRHRWLFRRSHELQRALGLKRRLPEGLAPRFGSQWWCLTRETCEAILDHIARRPADYAFFRTVWVPDEMCLQTLVGALVPAERIADCTLTFYQFSNYGKPLVFYDDHADYLTSLDYFFARKIAPEAEGLWRLLAAGAAAADDGAPIERIGAPDHRYAAAMRARGLLNRAGRLFAEDEAAAQGPGWLGPVPPPALAPPATAGRREGAG